MSCSDESAPGAPSGGAGAGASGGSSTGASASGAGATPATGAGGVAAGGSGNEAVTPGGLDCASPAATECAGSGPSSTGSGAAGAAADGGPDAGTESSDTRDAGAPLIPDPGSVFSPCPVDGSPCIVMPFGDSITEGFPVFNGGYRVELYRQALLGGHAITFVGDRANGPADVDGQPFPPNHDGFSGFTIDPSSRSGISPLAEPAIAAYRPHIILLMIGTNDIDLSIDVAGAPARLGALIDRITTAAPGLLLVVAQIVPTTNATTNERIRAYNAAIPALIEARQAAGQHVVGVDMYAAFTDNPDFATALMVDALHPNDAGYALLGQRFYDTIEPFLAAAP